MDFLLLLRRGDQRPLTEAEETALYARFVAWTEVLHRDGQLVAVESLHDGGRNVRGALVVDGPYAEGREAIVGLYVIRADDLDAATALARTVPHVAYGGWVEVRPTRAFPKPTQPTIAT